jgi:hypothetical protein
MKAIIKLVQLVILSVVNLISLILNFYLSAVCFLILFINESITGKENKELQAKFTAIMQKINNAPEQLKSHFA